MQTQYTPNLSFTTGKPIGVVTGGRFHHDIIHLFDPDVDVPPKRNEKTCRRMHIDDGKIFPIPSEKPEQLYVSGPNGSGKTYYIAQYLTLLREMYPKMPFYIFSDVEEDPLLDKITNVYRIPLTEELVDDPLERDDFKKSAVIFDDIDSISNKRILNAVMTLRDTLLKTSRHSKTYVICTNHLTTDYKNTRTLINECVNITIFPKSGAANQIRRVLKDYCGLDKQQVDTIYSLPSRWVTLHKNYPMYVISEHDIILL